MLSNLMHHPGLGDSKFDIALVQNLFRSGKKKNFFCYIKSVHKDNCGIPTLQKDGVICIQVM